MYELRKYQKEAVDETIKYLMEKDGNPVVVLPTGTGKSLVLAELCRRAIEIYHDTNIINATHNKELIQQNHDELKSVWPEGDIGIYSAGIGKKKIRKITFAGIQSVRKKAFHFPRIDLLMIDEAHTISRKQESTWHKFIKDLKTANPNMRILGLTASPFRMTEGKIYGEGCLFTEVSYEYEIIQAIEEGYLSPLHNHRTTTHYDVSGVGKRGGEYIENQLQKAVNVDELTKKCVAEIVEQGKDRKAWIAFCVGIDHALAVRDAIRAHGITCETVTGKTPQKERDAIIEDYKAGKIRCLTNMGVLTTGFNNPNIDLLISMRPTNSPGLWLQICGRAMRIAPGKENALVLDFADNSGRHGPLDKIRVKEKISSGNGSAPKKMCPECMEIIPASSRECVCGYIFPIDNAPKISDKSSGNILLSNQINIRTLTVKNVSYYRYVKEGKPDSFKCVYMVQEELKPITSWEFPENPKCLKRWGAWWQQRSKQPIPATVTQALEWKQTLTPPTHIKVRKEGKYDTIVLHVFG